MKSAQTEDEMSRIDVSNTMCEKAKLLIVYAQYLTDCTYIKTKPSSQFAVETYNKGKTYNMPEIVTKFTMSRVQAIVLPISVTLGNIEKSSL